MIERTTVDTMKCQTAYDLLKFLRRRTDAENRATYFVGADGVFAYLKAETLSDGSVVHDLQLDGYEVTKIEEANL